MSTLLVSDCDVTMRCLGSRLGLVSGLPFRALREDLWDQLASLGYNAYSASPPTAKLQREALATHWQNSHNEILGLADPDLPRLLQILSKDIHFNVVVICSKGQFPNSMDLKWMSFSAKRDDPRKGLHTLQSLLNTNVVTTGPQDSLDRGFLDQSERLLDLHVPVCGSNYLQELGRLQKERLLQLRESIAPFLHGQIPQETIHFVNAAFDSVALATHDVVESKYLDIEAANRARLIYGYRLPMGSTFQLLLETDPYYDDAPYLDEVLMRSLLGPTALTPEPLRILQKGALQHRFLHRPQRTGYMYLHEAIVGYYLRDLSGRAEPERSELEVTSDTYFEFPSYSLRLFASVFDIEFDQLLATHFMVGSSLEKILPMESRRLLLVADRIYQYLEMLMIYMQGNVGRRVNTDIHNFFLIPMLERYRDARGTHLRADIGDIIDDLFCSTIYGYADETGGCQSPHEGDAIRLLTELTKVGVE